MSGLLDAVMTELQDWLDPDLTPDDAARAAVEAVAAWLDGKTAPEPSWVAVMLRAEVAPPRPAKQPVTLAAGSTLLAGPNGEQGRWVTSGPVTLTWDGEA
jgi:hypothetical protein